MVSEDDAARPYISEARPKSEVGPASYLVWLATGKSVAVVLTLAFAFVGVSALLDSLGLRLLPRTPVVELVAGLVFAIVSRSYASRRSQAT